MLKKALLYSFLLIIAGFTGCGRLDNQMYNQSKIIRYKFDDFGGEVDFRLDTTYRIPEDRIHLMELVSKKTDELQGVNIQAVYVGDLNTIDQDTVILYCHGNRDHMDFYWQRTKLLANSGGNGRYGVMTLDYRGYGLSEGEPGEEEIYADVKAAMDWLQDQGVTSNRLIVYGYSLGAAPAAFWTVGEGGLKPSKIILENPFASAETIVQQSTGFAFPGSYYVDLKMDVAEAMKSVEVPLLMFYSKNNTFLPPKDHALVVYNNHRNGYKDIWGISHADHTELPLKMGFEKYNKVIHDFVENKN